MKNSYQMAILAALALGSASVATAQSYTSGDLLLGVYEPGAPNTEVYDLGNISALFDGKTWDLTSILAGAGFSSTLSSSAVFGVYGATTAGNGLVPHTEYLTTSARTPDAVPDYTTFGTFRAPVLALANNSGAQTVGSGQDYSSSLTAGAGGLTDALGYAPSQNVTDAASFWSALDDGSNPLLQGTFSLNQNTEVLTFNAQAVPEPGTCALIGGAGVLLMAFRNKFKRGQA